VVDHELGGLLDRLDRIFPALPPGGPLP